MANKNKYDWNLVWTFVKRQMLPVIKERWLLFLFFPATIADGFVAPYFFGQVVNNLTSQTMSWEVIYATLIWWVIAIVLTILTTYIFNDLYNSLGVALIRRQRIEIAKVLFYFDVKKYLDHKPGELYSKLDKMEYASVDLLTTFLNTYLRAAIFWVLSAVYIFLLDFRLGVLFSIGQIFFLIIFSARNNYLLKEQQEINDEYSRINGDLQDKTSNLLIVKNQAKENWEIDRFRQAYGKVTEKDKKLSKVWASSRIVLDLIQMILVVAAVLVGYFSIADKTLSVGALISCLWLFQRGANEMKGITQNWKTMMKFMASITEGQVIMSLEMQVKDKPRARGLVVKSAAVKFNNVNFDYENKAAIKNFSLTIKPGQTVALVGHSGAGKSTIATLLLRYYDLKSGEILIDGQNIAEVTQQSLRENIAFVMQDNSLFHEDLKFNIQYGNLNASMKDTEMASKKAQISDFIKQLEQGYETKVGQRGLRLSGGERQRIAIARAILKNAPILILDEATSALDSISEKKVQKALTTMMKGKTSLVIAHRLSTIKKADLIVVMKNGRIVETGRHSDLAKRKNGQYAKLLMEQVNGMLV